MEQIFTARYDIWLHTVPIRTPCNITTYPVSDQPHGFTKIKDTVPRVGYNLKLNGGSGNRNDQKSVLIMKRPQASAVYEIVCAQSKKAVVDISSVPLKHVIPFAHDDNVGECRIKLPE